jgi:hypothetical protein
MVVAPHHLAAESGLAVLRARGRKPLVALDACGAAAGRYARLIEISAARAWSVTLHIPDRHAVIECNAGAPTQPHVRRDERTVR